MNDTKFAFIGFVKLYTERPFFGNEPLLSQVHEIYGNGIIFGWAKKSFCNPLWTHKHEKRHSSIMMGKLTEGNHFANQMVVVCHLWTWHLSCLHIIQSIGYSADLQVDPISWVMSFLWVFQKNALSIVVLCVRLV